MAPICRFWQQGNCRNGDNCRFEHPGSAPVQNSNNRFSALQGPSNSNPRIANSYQNKSSSTVIPYALDKQSIIADLTTEKPQWILSAYGPGRAAPTQLFGGPLREQSFEEMRVAHYMGLATGNPQQAVAEAARLYEAAEQQIQTALNNVDGAIDFIIKAGNEHPNRIDICKASQGDNGSGFQQTPTTVQPTPSSNAFGAPSQPVSAFGAPSAPSGSLGQPSALGQIPNPFGAPAAQPGTFGQPSALGQNLSPFGAPSAPAGGFGQPSALGQKPSPFGAPTSAFGAPSQIGTGGSFGQPSALGQKPTPFGAPSSTFSNPTIAFSRPAAASSAFGAPSQPAVANPFDAPSQPITANPFTQPATQQQTNPFASQNPLSNAISNTSATPFGAPSPAPKNPFAATPQAPNPFGGNPIPQQNPFARGAAAQPSSNGFEIQQQNSSTNTSAFGKPSAASNGAGPGLFSSNNSQPAQPRMNDMNDMMTENLAQHPHPDNYIIKDNSDRLITFKSKRVVYKNNEPGFNRPDGSWEKIWFPNGAPAYNQETECEMKDYDDTIRKAYVYAMQHRRFENGMMPIIPPLREWCHWDF